LILYTTLWSSSGFLNSDKASDIIFITVYSRTCQTHFHFWFQCSLHTDYRSLIWNSCKTPYTISRSIHPHMVVRSYFQRNQHILFCKEQVIIKHMVDTICVDFRLLELVYHSIIKGIRCIFFSKKWLFGYFSFHLFLSRISNFFDLSITEETWIFTKNLRIKIKNLSLPSTLKWVQHCSEKEWKFDQLLIQEYTRETYSSCSVLKFSS
jgi:hypothetical protein